MDADDITDTLAPKSDQLDAVDLTGITRIFTITSVDVHSGAEQPVSVHFAELDRVWRPSKGMRHVLGRCWTRKSSTWVGKLLELYNDETVIYAGKVVGGVRIKRMSHIDGPTTVPLLVAQGRGGSWTVEPLTKVDCLRHEWRAATAERRLEIEAEIEAAS